MSWHHHAWERPDREAGCAKSVSGNFSLGLTLITIIAACGPGLAHTGWCWLRHDQTRDVTPEQEYQQALAEWGQRAAWHETAEMARLGDLAEWGSAASPASRTDIFGGTLAGWQALLTVHGASILAERKLLAVDLTGQHAAGMLTTAARDCKVDARIVQQRLRATWWPADCIWGGWSLLCTGAGRLSAAPWPGGAGPSGSFGGKVRMMADVACFCGCLYSFDGGAGACPGCGEVATVTARPAPAGTERGQQGQPGPAANGRGQQVAALREWAELIPVPRPGKAMSESTTGAGTGQENRA